MRENPKVEIHSDSVLIDLDLPSTRYEVLRYVSCRKRGGVDVCGQNMVDTTTDGKGKDSWSELQSD